MNEEERISEALSLPMMILFDLAVLQAKTKM
jgi:hypothetical protein